MLSRCYRCGVERDTDESINASSQRQAAPPAGAIVTCSICFAPTIADGSGGEIEPDRDTVLRLAHDPHYHAVVGHIIDLRIAHAIAHQAWEEQNGDDQE